MYFRSKESPAERIDVDPEDATALIRWYTGEGSQDDHRRAVRMMHQARRDRQWLVCECREAGGERPLMTPAHLLVADTFYLRRLTGPSRVAHSAGCAFHREQKLPAKAANALTDLSIKKPAGYFAIVRPEPETLAQRPADSAPAARTPQVAVPKIAKLLWTLIDQARLNTIPFLNSAGHLESSIGSQFHALRAAARRNKITAGHRLSDYLFTHPEDFFNGAVARRLDGAAPSWPKRQEPQAFLLSFTHEITKTSLLIERTNGEPDEIEHLSLRSPSTRADPSHGPYLGISVIAKAPYSEQYTPLQGWAQPVYSGHHFIPTRNAAERNIVALFREMQPELHAIRISTQLTRILFDIRIAGARFRPAFVLTAFNHETTRKQRIFLDPSDETTPELAIARIAQQARLAEHGAVISYEMADTETPALRNAIIDAIASN